MGPARGDRLVPREVGSAAGRDENPEQGGSHDRHAREATHAGEADFVDAAWLDEGSEGAHGEACGSRGFCRLGRRESIDRARVGRTHLF
jgi:hypothetical protein